MQSAPILEYAVILSANTQTYKCRPDPDHLSEYRTHAVFGNLFTITARYASIPPYLGHEEPAALHAGHHLSRKRNFHTPIGSSLGPNRLALDQRIIAFPIFPLWFFRKLRSSIAVLTHSWSYATISAEISQTFCIFLLFCNRPFFGTAYSDSCRQHCDALQFSYPQGRNARKHILTFPSGNFIL